MASGEGLNQSALEVFQAARSRARSMSVAAIQMDCGANLIDFGVKEVGGLRAGLELASICLGGLAEVCLTPGQQTVWPGPWVQISTDHPVRACLFGQYAGWPVQGQDFFAMGSGPMRLRRGKEPLLKALSGEDSTPVAVGVLECDALPGNDLLIEMAAECAVQPSDLHLAIAPTRSIAGCIQVVARSVETSLHKLHELGFPLSAIKQAFGAAPLPPPTPDFALGIGRTNDAILYGGHVTLWVDAEDAVIENVGSKLPSSSSRDFGEPFAEIFKRYQYDFYRVDPGLFSPAEVAIHNGRTGRSWHFGELREDLVAKSFAVTHIG
jgi:methenyltetrahydromethanopterin cyclohydrolase